MEAKEEKTAPSGEERTDLMKAAHRFALRVLYDGGSPQEVAILPAVLEILLENADEAASGN